MSDKIYIRHFKNNNKLDLLYNGLINHNEIYDILNNDEFEEYEYQNDKKVLNPILDLLNNYEDLIKILQSKETNIIEFMYLIKHKIFKILYDNDKTIFINIDLVSKFSDFYYLYYLIIEEKEITNFNYDFKLIKQCYDFLTTSKDVIQKVILSKIIIALINNYEGETDENQNDCLKLKQLCIENINKNKNNLNKYKIDLDLDYLDNPFVEITEIYSDILKYLIINNKLDESEETIDLLTALEIKNLRLNNSLFNSLKEVLIEKNLKNYEIKEYTDLFEENKIAFYFILFKYIFKDSAYIYQIPFLNEQRKNIIEIIKNNLQKFSSELKHDRNKSQNNKLKLFLEYFIEYEYYYQKGLEVKKKMKEESNSFTLNVRDNSLNSNNSSFNNTNSLNNSSDYNNKSSENINPFDKSSYLNRDNQNSLSNYEENGQNQFDKTQDLAFLILLESEFTFRVKYEKENDKLNFRFTKINIKNLDKIISIDEVKEYTSEDFNINNYYKKFIYYLKTIENEFQIYKSEKEMEISMKIKMQSENNFKVNCLFSINNNREGEEMKFIDENFLNESNHTGLGSLVDEILDC